MTSPGLFQQTYPDSFDERVEIILKELELAIQWDRPSVLLAMYNSEYVRADAETALKNFLIEQGQKVAQIQIDEPADAGFLNLLRKFQTTEDHVFFINGGEPGQRQVLAKLGHHKDILIRKKMRMVIWLTAKGLTDLALNATDLWDFRQQVIEFADNPKAEHVLQDAVESAWQGTGEYTDAFEDTEENITLHESVLAELPAKSESTSTRAKLLLTLGILNWRKGDFEKADELLQDALKAAVRMDDSWFEAECFNALALVKFAQGKNDDAIAAYKQAIAVAPEQIYVWNNLGNLCLKIQRTDEAMLAFQKTLKHNSKDSVAWTGLGSVYYRIGYLDDSIAAYRKAIELAPLLAQPWSGLGDAYTSTGRDLDAINAYQKAIERNKDFITPWLRLADIYCRQGRNRDAIRTYQRALMVNPKNHQIWNELGLVFLKVNAFEEATEAFLKAIELDRSFGWAYSNLALAYSHLGKYLDAIESCKKSLQVFTDDSDRITAWDRLANSYRAINDYENAMLAYQTADKLKKMPAPAYNRAADSVQAESAESKESASRIQTEVAESTPVAAESAPEESPRERAIPTWLYQPEASVSTTYSESLWKEDFFNIKADKLLEEENPLMKTQEMIVHKDPFENKEEIADSRNPEVWNQKGNVHFQSGEYEAAAIAYNKAIELDRSFGWSYSNLAYVYLTMGKYAEAILLYQTSAKLLKSNTEQAAAWNSLGNIYRHLNEYENALEAYQKADELDPQNAGRRSTLDLTHIEPNSHSAQVWIELGNLFFKSSSYKEAADAYTHAAKIDPASGWAHSNLAMSLVFQGKYKEAVSVYLKSIELFTSDKDKAVTWNRLGTVYRKLNDEFNARKAYQTAVILSNEKANLLTRTRFSLLGNCYAG
jgi:tetratricopeptide (TPR) repeat protein